MAKYIKKPKPIEAMKWDGTDAGRKEIEAHFPELVTAEVYYCKPGALTNWYIKTANGKKNVIRDQYVFKDEGGQFWTMGDSEIICEYDEVNNEGS